LRRISITTTVARRSILLSSAVLATVGLTATVQARPSAARARIRMFRVAPGGDPWGTAIDRFGDVWFAEPRCDVSPSCPSRIPPGRIGELNPSSRRVRFYRLPKMRGNQPVFLAFDRSDHLWFTTPTNSRIGEFNPSTGRFIGQWLVTPGNGPWDLTFADGKLWYTDHWGSAVSYFNVSQHTHRDFPMPSANSNPYGIAASRGLLWFAENNISVDRVGVLDTKAANRIS
jgi:streptogramin lyase